MIEEEALVALITEEVMRYFGGCVLEERPLSEGIPVSISVRHCHLCPSDIETLFGQGHQLTNIRELYQPGFYACKETVTVVGSRGVLTGVRVLGPPREASQVEVSRTDAVVLGVMPPVRQSVASGDGAPITLAGPKGVVTVPHGLIRAKRHIHMSPAEAQQSGLGDGALVNVRLPGEQSLTLHNVLVRTGEGLRAEMHIDTDEGNAANVLCGTRAQIAR